MIDLDEIRRVALALPEAHEKLCYGTPAFYVRRALFARMLEDGESLVVKVAFSEREALTLSAPETFVVTPHYERYPMVVIRLGAVARDELEEQIEEAWRQVAPKRLLI